MLSDNNKNKPDSGFFTEKITVPWLIVTIFSMISFLAFLISMFFGKFTSIFFGVFILAIASVVLLDGIHKQYEQTEKAENGGGDAEDAAGEANNEHKKP